MRKKKWKKSRAILPLLLSAMMIVEPIGMANTVYAEEVTPITETIGSEQEDELENDVAEGAEEKEQETNDGVTDGTEGNVDEQGDGEDDKKDEGSASDTADENTESSENPSETEVGEDQETDQDGEDEQLPDDETLEEEVKEDAEAEEDAASENDLDEEENAALNGFKGMPDSYKLSSKQMESKKSLSAHAGEIGEFEAGANYAEGEVVTLVETREEAEMIAEAYNAEIVDFEYGVLTLKLNPDVTVAMAVKVAADMNINMPAVWPNYRRYLMGEEPVSDSDGIEIEMTEYDAEEGQTSVEEASDTSYLAVTDDYLNPRDSHYQWQHTVIGSPYAWAAGSKGQNIKVAVLDSGVASHSDLPTVNSLNSSATTDNVGHGTHVAGIIGARANNGLGAGVAPEVILYSYNLGDMYSSDIMKGIKAAKAANVDVINMSIGGLGFVEDEQTCVDEAYNAGIAIFVAAGNDGGQNYNYPACYKHVISVAATDKNNERASFSNYSNMVDLSAPGVDIWSTSNTNASAYVAMSGTSMACPVAAGEAAVILSANKITTSGSKRVDDLEKLMKSNAVKAGSGMGSGITSLTKLLGLSTAETKPNAPDIVITPDDTAKAQKVDVTITAPDNVTIYYTTNGKNPVFKDGKVDSSAGTTWYTGPFSISKTAKATIKAIAVNESGVSSAVKSVSYTLKPYVTGIVISGPKNVAKGKNIQLTATVTPTYATNKKVTWELRNSNGTELSADAKKNLKISGGKVTATKDAVSGKYQVVVTAQDDSKKSVTYDITVIEGVRVKAVKFVQEKGSTAVLKNLPLELPTEASHDLMQNLVTDAVSESDTFTAADFRWTSNNKSIASVNDSGVVTAKKAGKATITALADDSSGKKATVTVTVTQLATDLEILAPATAKSDGTVIAKIAPGKNATFKAAVTPTWTTNKKVTWEIYDTAGKKIETKADVNIAANGKVTAAKNAKPGVYTIKAITQDAAKKTAEAKIQVTSGIISKLSFPAQADANVKIFRKTTDYTDYDYNFGLNTVTIKAKIEGAEADLTQYTVSNSNSGIARYQDISTPAEMANGNITLRITATGRAAGKTKITIASTDGSNKKLTCNVTVVNPVSAITIAPAAGANECLVPGKSLQLKARVESENGVISNKAVSWTMARMALNNNKYVPVKVEPTDGVKISASGKVTAGGNAKTSEVYMVQAEAKDGSGVFDQYYIYVEKAATILDVYQGKAGGKKVIPSAKYTLPMITEGYVMNCDIVSDLKQGGFTVSSSNPAVLSVSYSPYYSNGNAYVNYGYMSVATHKKGTATITVKAMDGSGKQMKFTLIVQ